MTSIARTGVAVRAAGGHPRTSRPRTWRQHGVSQTTLTKGWRQPGRDRERPAAQCKRGALATSGGRVVSESEGDDDLRLEPHERLVDLGGKRVAVVGLGASGLAAAALALDRGASRVAMLDSNPSGPTDAQVEVARDLESSGSCEVALRFGPHDLADFEGWDVIVCSPGVPASSIAPLVLPRVKPPTKFSSPR